MELIQSAILRLRANTIRLEANCESLRTILGLVASNAGMSSAEVLKRVDDTTELAYQNILEQIETQNPGLAAELDKHRKGFPQLPDELL